MNPNSNSKQVQAGNDVPPFPHHAAPPQAPLEAAERQYGDRPTGVPNWQPDDGDYT